MNFILIPDGKSKNMGGLESNVDAKIISKGQLTKNTNTKQKAQKKSKNQLKKEEKKRLKALKKAEHKKKLEEEAKAKAQ